ncbi:SDR family oxidoreductase [Streptomyces sp. SP18BB07]|uniref:SDR family oxidoreductase n=1 Tax=Streptomyces sp. SP18BB07 TaxID=3002522 RepID=UPI002E78E5F9|nr:SDR family NAD(P)-dependent oxidoreductase [Streptomyces sp. SP18BB07]MEE1765186.1 SDR family NAD(P)-dependent oxidoreductase [Streptomyces sp. SP18BB07]
MTAFKGRVAVITGAGSGIGQALAVALASEGQGWHSPTSTPGVLPRQYCGSRRSARTSRQRRVDVTDRETVQRCAGEVVGRFGNVHQLYNDAGLAYHGAFERSALEDIEQIMNIDFWGVLNFSKAFLPHLIASGAGHVVNISSIFGPMTVPGQTAYSSAKFAVRGFTESLRQDMLAASHPVKVTCVHPGSVRTAIARNAGMAAGEDRSAVVYLFDRKMARLSRRRGADDPARRAQKQGTCTRRRRRQALRRLHPHRGALLPTRHRGRRGTSASQVVAICRPGRPTTRHLRITATHQVEESRLCLPRRRALYLPKAHPPQNPGLGTRCR